MAEPLRVPLYGRHRKLLGYWYVRQRGGQYLVTAKTPDDRRVKYAESDPRLAVARFYQAYVDHQLRRLNEVDQKIQQLPDREYKKPGFRRGWVARLRSQLAARKAALLAEARKGLVTKFKKLREGGWPAEAAPLPPWELIDGKHAAESGRPDFFRQRDLHGLPPEPKNDQLAVSPARAVPPAGREDTDREPDPDSPQKRKLARWGGPPISQAVEQSEAGAGGDATRAGVTRYAWRAGKEIRPVEGTYTTDSRRHRGAPWQVYPAAEERAAGTTA